MSVARWFVAYTGRPRIKLLLACLLVVQGLPFAQNPSAPPLTVETAPETLVYQLFFEELLAAQRAAGKKEQMGESSARLMERYRQITGLFGGDFQLLLDLAGSVAETREAQKTKFEQAAQALLGAVTPEERRQTAARLAELRAEVENAQRQALDQLRLRLGRTRFSQFDRRVREYVVPQMKVSGPDFVPGGRQ